MEKISGRAIKQKPRTPEGTLHLMALTGGVLGARLGQKVFRHKTLKGSFQRVFWFIVFLQAMRRSLHGTI